MQKDYNTKDIKPSKTKKKEKVLPIFQKRNDWCFRHNGDLLKFSSEAEAKEMYKALN